MASTKSVIVLAPNGRRQNVKVTPNTTILQILEEVCKKQNLKAEEYDIKHHNHVLDVSSMLRFSGLPNNAQLEMCAIQRTREESSVILGLQLENGNRLTGNFIPNDNLWDIITKMCPDDVELEKNPVVIYMRQEIYGTALKTTSLRSLGLTNGRAMLRLVHRQPEELKIQANVSSPIPPKPVVEKPYIKKIVPLDEPESRAHPVIAPKHEPEPKSPKETRKNFLTDFIKQEKSKKATDGKTVKIMATGTEERMDVDPPGEYERPVEEFAFLGERNALAFSLDMAATVPHEDLPDEFFELTLQDARKLLHDMKKKRVEIEESPLQTSAIRSLEHNKKILRNLHQYKKAIIRVQFPDRTVLQGSFKPTETVEVVQNFVKDYLEDSSQEFHLYTTPPKSILNQSSTLLEIECVPSAIVHFSYNDSVRDDYRYLKSNILEKFTSHSVASIAAARSRGHETNRFRDDDEQMDFSTDTSNYTSGPSTSTADSSGLTYERPPRPAGPPEKVPKWFKPNK